MPSLGPQQGEELGEGGGGPPAWPSPVTPTLVECEEDEDRGERGTLISGEVKGEETDVRSWDSLCFFFLFHPPRPRTTDFLSSTTV